VGHVVGAHGKKGRHESNTLMRQMQYCIYCMQRMRQMQYRMRRMR